MSLETEPSVYTTDLATRPGNDDIIVCMTRAELSAAAWAHWALARASEDKEQYYLATINGQQALAYMTMLGETDVADTFRAQLTEWQEHHG